MEELAEQLAIGQVAVTDPWQRPRFELSKELGAGGQGTVYEVLDRDTCRPVALKVLSGASADSEQLARFVHEAQVTAQLAHPGIVPVHELGRLEDGTLYYTMKRIEGRTLADLLDRQAGKPSHRFDLLQIFLRVCDALAFAHDRGVVHRDLKPRNVMVGPFGEVLVLDWGLAKIMGQSEVASVRSKPVDDSDTYSTRSGLAVGTPAYMSPEQARGRAEEIDPRSDIYSLGVILYEILAGQSPYPVNKGTRHLMRLVADAAWEPLEGTLAERHSVPRSLVAIVTKSLAPLREQRYASVQSLVNDLRAHLAGEAVSACHETALERWQRKFRRHRSSIRLAGAILGVLALAAGIGAGILWWQHRSEIAAIRSEARSLTDPGAAHQAWQRLLTLDPTDGEAVQMAVETQNRHRQQMEAAGASEQRRRHLENAKALAQQAELGLSGGDAAQCRASLDLATRALGALPAAHDDSDRLTLSLRQRILALRDRIHTRLADLQAAQARDEGRSLLSAADSHMQAGRLVEARLAYERASRLLPIDDSMRSLQQSLELAETASRERERIAGATRLRHEALSRAAAGELGAAVAAMEASLALQPAQEDGTRLLGELLTRRQQAERLARQAIFHERAEALVGEIRAAAGRDDAVVAGEGLARLRELGAQAPELPQLQTLPMLEQAVEAARRRAAATAAGALALQAAAAQDALDNHEIRLARQRLRSDELRERIGEGLADTDERRAHGHIQQDIHGLETEVARLDAASSELLVRALVLAPEHPPVRAALARLSAQRLRRAERLNDRAGIEAAAAAGRSHDRVGAYGDLFENHGRLLVRGDAAGLLPLHEGAAVAPDEGLALADGVELRVPAGRHLVQWRSGARQAVHIQRGASLVLESPPVVTPPPGMAMIPAGILAHGEASIPAFFLARRELTLGEWLLFLADPDVKNDLRRQRRERGAPWRLVPRDAWDSPWPRLEVAEDGSVTPVLALRDLSGAVIQRQPLDPDRSVSGISREDVDAYLAWRRRQDGQAWRLPRRDEWRLAMQAGDGRPHTWGWIGDPLRCLSGLRDAPRDGQPPPAGCSDDRSIHGLEDLAGLLAEMVDDAVPGQPQLGVVCGGSYLDRELQRFSDSARRLVDRRLVQAHVGVRLALDP